MKKNEKPAFAKNIISRRKSLGFKSARVFAEHIKIPYGTYRDIEAGYSEGWKDTKEAIADGLGCSISELFKVKEPGAPEKDFTNAAEFFSNLAGSPHQVQQVVLAIVFFDSNYLRGLPEPLIVDATKLLRRLGNR